MMRAAESWKTGVVLSTLLIVAMTAATEYSGCHEFFFPELLAMAMGCFWMAKRPWRTTRGWLFLSLVAGGILGWALSLLPGPGTLEKILIGYALCGVWLAWRRINVTPMFSACLLPLLLGRTGWIYPVAIAVEMAVLCAAEWLLERWHLRPEIPFQPLEGSFGERLWRWLKLTAFLCVLLLLARRIGSYLAIPPLIVGFSVFADLYRPARKHYFAGVGVCAAAALLGCAGRYCQMESTVAFPLLTAAMVILFAWLCRKAAYFLPPSAAIMLLAFLIPAEAIAEYLWQVPVGAALFLGAGRLFSLREERQIQTAAASVAVPENKSLLQK